MGRLDQSGGETQQNLLDMMGVTTTLTLEDDPQAGVRISVLGGQRVQWLPCAISALNGDKALEELMMLSADANLVHQYVIVEKTVTHYEDCPQIEPDILVVNDVSANQVNVRVNSTAPGWILLADTWYPGWQASIDGEETEVLRANYLFRAIQVPEGQHVVRFTYHAKSFFYGGVTSLVCLICAGFFMVKAYRIPQNVLEIEKKVFR
jgi:hypothetical protein